jgi:hypothetical protein
MDEEIKLEKEEFISFLQNPGSYPHEAETVELIQTHISYVAIAPPYVYKIKKPVNLGFLDFSTLQKRHHFCKREVQLNRRLCKDIYEGVVPLSRLNGDLVLGDEKNTVEYAVKMKQLDADGFLDRRLKNGGVEPQDLDRLVKHLSRFYREQKSSGEIAECGYIYAIGAVIRDNFTQTESFVGDLIAGYAFEAIQEFNEQFFCRYSCLLNRRRTEGHILDCHGDLRLEHIHFGRDGVRVFDCIEFNDAFRYIDVANEVAFLAMDLDFHGRRDLSRYFVRQMADFVGDEDLLKLLDFYKCYRAYVRAKVHALKSVEAEVPEQQKARSRDRAMSLFSLSLEYAISGSEPMVIVIMGRIGTGKSTISGKLSDALGWEIFSSDTIRKQLAGIPLTPRTDADVRENIYTRDMTDKTYCALRQRSLECAKQGRSCLVDATFGSAEHRNALRDALESNSIRFCFVELIAADETVRNRLSARQRETDNISDARLEDFEKLSSTYRRPDALEQTMHIIIDTEQLPDKALFDVLQGVMHLKPLKV